MPKKIIDKLGLETMLDNEASEALVRSERILGNRDVPDRSSSGKKNGSPWENPKTRRVYSILREVAFSPRNVPSLEVREVFGSNPRDVPTEVGRLRRRGGRASDYFRELVNAELAPAIIRGQVPSCIRGFGTPACLTLRTAPPGSSSALQSSQGMAPYRPPPLQHRRTYQVSARTRATRLP